MRAEYKTFSITKEFIADTLFNYYHGDDSFKNPMKMFLESGAIDQEVISMVFIKNGSTNRIANKFATMDLWLNNDLRHMAPTGMLDSVKNFIHDVITKDLKGIKVDKYVGNFYEANISERDFEWLYPYDMMDITEDGVDRLSEALLKHKDYPLERKMLAYERTGDDSFLPKEAVDLFIF